MSRRAISGVISPDGELDTFATVPPGNNPITMSDDGRLFLALCYLGDNVYEIDMETREPTLMIEAMMGAAGSTV